MKYRVVAFVAVFVVGCVCCRADNARFCIHVVDERTGLPLSGMMLKGVFIERFLRWENAVVDHDFTGVTNQKGDYAAAGKTNCGEAGFRLCGNNGFYDTKFVKVPFDLSGGKPMPIFQWWRPDNQVVTVELQRVEHPIPLFVKRVELRDYEHGIGGFDGTNSVLRFDLLKGDWLHPYGNGEVADICIGARVNKTGSERRFLPQEGTWGVLQFYDIIAKFELCDGDCLSREAVKESAGIKIRSVAKDGVDRGITRTKGKRKQIGRNKDWHCEYFSDSAQDRCYTFRIRTRRNEKGELVEAYYGKVYGDFEFEGNDKKGLIGVKFLYYLNPKPLDRNLEWDMKNNLCPNPGNLSMPQP